MEPYSRQKDHMLINIPGSSYSRRGKNFDPILERDEHVHSADPNKSNSKLFKNLNRNAVGKNSVALGKNGSQVIKSLQPSDLSSPNGLRLPHHNKENDIALPPLSCKMALDSKESKQLNRMDVGLRKNGQAIMSNAGSVPTLSINRDMKNSAAALEVINSSRHNPSL